MACRSITLAPATPNTPQVGELTFVFSLPGQDVFYTGANSQLAS